MSKEKLFGLGMMSFLAIGGLAGYVVTYMPKWAAVVCGILFSSLALFVGVVLSTFRHRQMAVEREKEDTQLIANLRRSAMKMLDQQSKAYGEVSKAQSNIVSMRIGHRVVEEMLHGLENDEQRDAAYRQVGVIIEEELAKVNEEVWGDKPCPSDDSGG